MNKISDTNYYKISRIVDNKTGKCRQFQGKNRKEAIKKYEKYMAGYEA